MSEEKVIRKWMWVWDFEKEERWLNTMARPVSYTHLTLPTKA